MMRCIGSLLAVLFLSVLSVFQAGAQVDRIAIGAGSDEDRALQDINSEQDPAKRVAMYQDFIKKFASNPQALAYGNWQLSMAYAGTGDFQKALDYGDKALADSPRNIDILMSQASASVQAKKFAKAMEYSLKGGEVCHSVGKEPKPEGMGQDEFERKLAAEKDSMQETCDYLATSAIGAIAGESNPRTRITYIEKFSAAFPEPKYGDQVSGQVLVTLGQLNDPARLVAFCEKMLASDPNSTLALLMLAGHNLDAGSLPKAISYSQKVIEIAKADAPDADKKSKVSAATAHNTIGWAYLKQEKSAAAIQELRIAAGLAKGQDDQQYARALYGIGFAYAKDNKLSEAREVLTTGSKIPGPMQAMTQDLLLKVNRARAGVK